jgi:predicted metalloprotease with PDZ domain
MKSRYAAAISATMHAAFIASLLVSCEPPRPPREEQPLQVAYSGGDIADKGDGYTCTKYYIGIGVRIDWTNDSVAFIAEGYPAYQHGIREGDRILNDLVLMDQKEGIEEKLIVQKGTARRVIKIVPSKICLT